MEQREAEEHTSASISKHCPSTYLTNAYIETNHTVQKPPPSRVGWALYVKNVYHSAQLCAGDRNAYENISYPVV